MDETVTLSLLNDKFDRLAAVVARMEARLACSTVKEAYTVKEAAERLHRVDWTVRDWCNRGQVKAKKVHGKGRTGEWRIEHDEIVRLQKEGPKPERYFLKAA